MPLHVIQWACSLWNTALQHILQRCKIISICRIQMLCWSAAIHGNSEKRLLNLDTSKKYIIINNIIIIIIYSHILRNKVEWVQDIKMICRIPRQRCTQAFMYTYKFIKKSLFCQWYYLGSSVVLLVYSKHTNKGKSNRIFLFEVMYNPQLQSKMLTLF